MNEGLHAVKVQGFPEAHHRPQMEDLFFLTLRKKTRDQSDRNPTEMADTFQDFLTIHHRHRGIKKDKIVMVLLDLPEPLFTAERAIDLVPLLFKGLAEFFADHLFVVDDQQFDDSGPLPKAGRRISNRERHPQSKDHSKPGNLKFSRSVSK